MSKGSDRSRGAPSRRDALGVGAVGLGAMLGGCVTPPGQGAAVAQDMQTSVAPRASEPQAPRAPRGDGRLLTPTISAWIANIRNAPGQSGIP